MNIVMDYFLHVRRWLKQLSDYGMCLLTGVPVIQGQVMKVISRKKN